MEFSLNRNIPSKMLRHKCMEKLTSLHQLNHNKFENAATFVEIEEPCTILSTSRVKQSIGNEVMLTYGRILVE